MAQECLMAALLKENALGGQLAHVENSLVRPNHLWVHFDDSGRGHSTPRLGKG
jgi:hypothetical protein